MLQNKLRVILESKSGSIIASYDTSKFEETVNFYKSLMDNQIQLLVDNDKLDETKSAWIDDMDVHFPNDDNLFSLHIYCDVV